MNVSTSGAEPIDDCGTYMRLTWQVTLFGAMAYNSGSRIVLVPSTNTILEPELYAMAPKRVTCHVSRMYVPQSSIGSAPEVETFIQNVRAATDVANPGRPDSRAGLSHSRIHRLVVHRRSAGGRSY